jgi:ribonuclease HI
MNNLDILLGINEEITNRDIKPILTKVAAHTNIPGNERADFLAKEAIQNLNDQLIVEEKPIKLT